jgi:Tol biopolymer transport system component
MKFFIVGLVLSFLGCTCGAQDFKNIEYLCADWGAAMRLPSKEGEKPKFSETREEIYFLKQMGRFTRNNMQDEGKGITIYLCKMNPDGSGKTELKELWKNPNFPIDTQGQSCWLDVNEKTRKVALAIAFAGNEITGLWTMNLDGSELRRIIIPEQNEKHLQSINHPSWTPDGRWIVFQEELRGMNPNRHNISKCDANGKHFVRILEGTEQIHYMQPSVSPDGTTIAFTKFPDNDYGDRYIWLANIDGTQARPLVQTKRVADGWGTWPAWSPDGKRIWAISIGIVDVASGQTLLDRRPVVQGREGTCGWAHWGKAGFVGLTAGGILFTDLELREGKWIGSSKLVECSTKADSCRW